MRVHDVLEGEDAADGGHQPEHGQVPRGHDSASHVHKLKEGSKEIGDGFEGGSYD